MAFTFQNKFTGIGTVAADPRQLIEPAVGGRCARIRFYVKIRRHDQKNVDDYIPVVLWGTDAEKFVREVSKDDKVRIQGRFEKNKELKQTRYVVGKAQYRLVDRCTEDHNEFIGIGSVADDPQQEFRLAANGNRASVHFDINIPRGGRKNEDNFVPVVLWGEEAEQFAGEASEGDIVQIYGRLERNRNLETKQIYYVIGNAFYGLVEKRS